MNQDCDHRMDFVSLTMIYLSAMWLIFRIVVMLPDLVLTLDDFVVFQMLLDFQLKLKKKKTRENESNDRKYRASLTSWFLFGWFVATVFCI